MKTKKDLSEKSQALNIILLSVIFLWLALITKFAIDSRSYHLQQAKHDSEAIYQLMIQNAEQQTAIDELSE